jgi:hypothetical protein
MSNDNLTECSCNGGIFYGISQCKSCVCQYVCDASGCGPSTCVKPNLIDITQKRIWNTVKVPASEYTMNLSSLNVYQVPSGSYANVNWNQASDRAVPANTSVSKVSVVPSRGNSTKSSITRLRPGSLKPGGFGVDIKHGSYDRYLARLKGKGPLKTQQPSSLTVQITNSNGQTVALKNNVIGNKTRNYGIVGSSKKTGSGLCFC